MSGGGTPYIGSKISLVSKAKIRYEGYLYTIDTEESTVTLAKVKSFGTENRKVTNKVPARNEIYEYIVFRGSDIDDLHVAAGPNDNKQGQVGEDPAIVQTGNTQPSMYQQQMPVQLGTPFPPQSYGPFGAMPYGYPMGFRPQGNMPLSSVIGPAGMADRNSRSSPFDRYRKSPSPPGAGPIGSRYQSVKDDDRSQSLESGSNVGRQRESQRLFDGQAYPQKVSKEQKVNQLLQKENEIPIENAQDAQPAIRKQSKDNDQQRERHKGYSENREQTRTKDQPRNQESSRSSRKHEWRDPNAKEKTDAKEKNWKKQGNEGQKKISSETTTKSSTKEVKKETNKEENASNPPSSNETKGHSRGRGRGRGRGGYNKTRQFDKDFDFERANAKFNKEEIEKELLSLKKHVSLKDEDVIVEDGYKVSELDDIEAEVNGEDVYYDKSKSFFDQISCDSVGQSNDSMSRRKERALNVETFGVLTRNYRGRPYRGRGGRGGRSRGYGRGGQNARRGGRGSNRAWVDYDFDFEAAGIRQGGRSHKSGAS